MRRTGLLLWSTKHNAGVFGAGGKMESPIISVASPEVTEHLPSTLAEGAPHTIV